MKKIYVFGAGGFLQRHIQELTEQYNIISIIDNDSSKENSYESTNIIINTPKKCIFESNTPIIVMTKKCVDIIYQLLELGIEGKNISFGYQLFPETEKEDAFLSQGTLLILDKRIIYLKNDGCKMLIQTQEDFDIYENQIWDQDKEIKEKVVKKIADLPLKPVDEHYGQLRGKAVDRYYIEKFLEKNEKDVSGDVLEIETNGYTLKYGNNHINSSTVLHVYGWGENTIKGNLETGEGIIENGYDCLIITQTLMFIYHLQDVALNIWKMLKDNGVALITVSGLAQTKQNYTETYGDYYRFFTQAMRRLFEPIFGKDNVEIESYGNVKIVTALLYGLCCDDLEEDDFLYQDGDYPVIITVRLKKVAEYKA